MVQVDPIVHHALLDIQFTVDCVVRISVLLVQSMDGMQIVHHVSQHIT